MSKQIIFKEDLNTLITNWKDEDVFSECVTKAIQLGVDIHENKSSGVNENYKNYVRVDMMYQQTTGNTEIDRLLVAIRCWIDAYSKTNRMLIGNISKKTGLSIEELLEVVNKYGEIFDLYYAKQQDKYRRVFKYISISKK